MPVERCARCERFIDLDLYSNDVEYLNNKAVCVCCLTDDELRAADMNLEAHVTTRKIEAAGKEE